MGNKDKTSKNTGGVAAGIAMAASVLPLVKPAVDTIRDYVDKTIEERKKLVSVPILYSKEYPLTVEQAVEMLNSYGLKSILVKMTIAEADARYRTCFDSQVIKTQPRAKQKVERGASILVKYITQEIIDESQRLFDEAEKQKAELLFEKRIKHSDRKEKTKRVVTGITGMVKQGVEKIPSILYKKKSIKEEQDEQQ